jgi:hypothetical protein
VLEYLPYSSTTEFPIARRAAGTQPISPVSLETGQHGPLLFFFFFFLEEENLAKSEESPTCIGTNMAKRDLGPPRQKELAAYAIPPWSPTGVLSAWFVDRFSGVLGQCVIKKLAAHSRNAFSCSVHLL